ncbi:SDR family NAD(P)-dependent oxidoreductase [Sphingorhabdus sp.]|uniref:SDR family NAD(P)-dependent oxidoreductase n=1 Tax=Sphingorhabdus sp. TaxID=1902408 RepID=UPI00359335D2
MTVKTAVIIGASGGIGAAIADRLTSDNSFDQVLRLSRNSSPAIDLLDETSIANAASSLAQSALAPSLIIVATGILHKNGKGPEKSLRELDPDWMIENYRLNAVGPALVAKHFLPLMPKFERTCFAVLSARVGSISDNRLGGWHSYRTSKAALNMLIRNLAIEWQRRNPESIIIGLHPGTVETTLSAPFKGNPKHERFTPEKAASLMLAAIQKLQPQDSGELIGYDGGVIAP